MIVLREGEPCPLPVEGESTTAKILLRVHEAAEDRLTDRQRMDLWSF